MTPLLLLPTTVSAQVTISARETGGNVVFTVSGSFDPGTPNGAGSFTPETVLAPANGSFEIWTNNSNIGRYILDSAVPFGTGSSVQNVGVGVGSNIAIFSTDLYLDQTYTAGTPFNGTLTFNGTTFATLGVSARALPYVWTVTNSGATITLRFPDAERKQFLGERIKAVRKQLGKARRLEQSSKVKRLTKQLKRLVREFKAL